MEDDWMNLTEVAQQAGVTKSAISHARTAGRIHGEKRGREWFFPVETVDFFANSPRNLMLKTADKDLGLELLKANIRKVTAEAEMKEMESAKMRGTLVDYEEIMNKFKNAVLNARAKMLNLRHKLVLPLCEMTDPAEIGDYLELNFDEFLTELSKGEKD